MKIKNFFSHFELLQGVHFINCATRGPFSKAVVQAGITSIEQFTPGALQIVAFMPHCLDA